MPSSADIPVASSSPVAAAIEWLLSSDEPALVRLTRRDLLGEDAPVDEQAIRGGPLARALLDAPLDVNPYKKWQGAHWRLVSLAELEVPPDARVLAAAEQVLGWLTGDGHRRRVRVVDGLVRRCASQEGNAVAACSRLGLAHDPRVQLLMESLVEWQWPDGGWNCDLRATGRRSSFHESLAPMWGLHEYWAATGEAVARDAAQRVAELLLEHRLFRSLSSGEPVAREWLEPHYPPYWHYDVPQALLILSRMELVTDPRAADGIELLLERRRPDGTWSVAASWWRPPGREGANVEVVDWGRRGPSRMLTLNALRVLAAAGRV